MLLKQRKNGGGVRMMPTQEKTGFGNNRFACQYRRIYGIQLRCDPLMPQICQTKKGH